MSAPAPWELGQDGDWLAGCDGFRVDSPGGRLGLVDEVRRDPASGRPAAPVVRAGKVVPHRVVVPVEKITAVVPSARLVLLRERWPLTQADA